MMADSQSTTDDAPRPMAFEVDFECRNCGDEWSHEYPANYLVRDVTSEKGVSVHDDEQFGGTERVPCPTCELTREVTVDDRSPLDGEDDD